MAAQCVCVLMMQYSVFQCLRDSACWPAVERAVAQVCREVHQQRGLLRRRGRNRRHH